ncbi:hypothetical protein DKK70_09555 [Gilliamella apicola]|uniref:Uncharacterized protein n=1 Tax=Gilliamella apicola TaxID=1196095 RepID=A0A2V4E7K6_9GAMM|nr:hypothetical protein [Gilliamella apicola]PXZ06896.1 hypothetical protein DKK70_09555 [Gilliamella apicola]
MPAAGLEIIASQLANSGAIILDTVAIEYDLNKLRIDLKIGSDGARMTDLVSASALNKQGLNNARFISKASIETLFFPNF